MKILLIHNRYQQPGGEDVVVAQERQLLQSRGHEVEVYERSNDELLAYSPLHKLAVPKTAVWAEDSRREVLDVIRRLRPAIVHVHNTFMMISPSIYSACRQAGVPVVQTLHNFRFLCPAASFFRNGEVCEECLQSLWHSVAHGCYRGSRPATATAALMLAVHRRERTWDAISSFIALSRFAQQKFVSAGFPETRVHVKPNFVSPDPGKKDDEGDCVVYVGRLSAEKGVETLIEACRYTQSSVPLEIIGDGPLGSKLRRAVLENRLSQVNFRGRLSRMETQELMKRARCVILPSKCYENFPMAAAEAFACGVPVLCSRLGAMQEIVEDRATGLHFKAGNAADLAEKMDWFWAHPGEARAMGRTARRVFERDYTAESNYQSLMTIYRQALETYA